jgi:hypothetical protein
LGWRKSFEHLLLTSNKFLNRRQSPADNYKMPAQQQALTLRAT